MPKSSIKTAARQVPIPAILSIPEAERIAQKLAIALEYETESIALLLLLINHLEAVREDMIEFTNATFSVKQKLFVGTTAASNAQTAFETKAMMKRGDLLLWPSERTA